MERPLTNVRRGALLACVMALAAGTPANGQPPPPRATRPPNSQPETSTRQEATTFKTRVNLVTVPVVARDSQGHAVGTFRKEDFQLFDRGKPQVITRFSVEKSGPKASREGPVNAGTGAPVPTGEPPPPADLPERFLAYLFDDQHLQAGDVKRVRDAAMRHMTSLQATDRAAIYTTSGHNQIEFTDDREKLLGALERIRPASMSDPGAIRQCPDIGYYMADMIVNKGEVNATKVATLEAMYCIPGTTESAAAELVKRSAYHSLNLGSQETRLSLYALSGAVRRLSGMPGQRIVILASPGFLTPQEQTEESEVIDRAIHDKVVINALDARGLWVDPMADASEPNAGGIDFIRLKLQYDREAATAQANVLAEMAYGTGGSFFQNSNDLDEGFRRLAAAPEYSYILGFSPQNLKFDGSFHALRVTLKAAVGVSVQARRGYSAPKELSGVAETARQEIEEALFSREEMSDIPVQLQTRFFKTTDKDARLTVRCLIDPKHIQFRKADGRNYNTLTIVSGIFDRNGNYISGIQKSMELSLKDESLPRFMASKMAITTDFSVPPGAYTVRVVVRDSVGQLMSAANTAVAIP